VRLLQQGAVGGELALVRLRRGGERAVVLGDPELAVLGVQDLVDRDAKVRRIARSSCPARIWAAVPRSSVLSR
jgi:hypothetical protein